jgi:MFS family permease
MGHLTCLFGQSWLAVSKSENYCGQIWAIRRASTGHDMGERAKRRNGAAGTRSPARFVAHSQLWLACGCIGIIMVVFVNSFTLWFIAAALMGLGTAFVYPTLLAAISDVAHPNWRSSAIGVYRLWRDSGYAIGARM